MFRQYFILPAAGKMLDRGGEIVTLIKPHYEAPAELLRKGVLPAEALEQVMESVRRDIREAGFEIVGITESPIKGAKGNVEMLAHLRRDRTTDIL